MRARWSLNARAAALGLVVTALLLGPAAAANATPPVTLGTGYVLDDVGILTTDEISTAEANLAEFRDESGLDLWVVFVDEFTDPSSSADWAYDAAEQNGLGPTQYLLAAVLSLGRQRGPRDGRAARCDRAEQHAARARRR